jgi:hypothetical protein
MTGRVGVGKGNMDGQRKTQTQMRETHHVVVVADGVIIIIADVVPI